MSPPERSAGSAQTRATLALSARSDLALAFFGRVFERTLRNGFHALRIAKAEPPPGADIPRLVIYSNHPSWWDGVAYVVLSRLLWPTRRFYAPIDSRMLQRYGMLARLGAFGVDQSAPRGAADFLAACRTALADPLGGLMVAAQGRFSDVRERPVGLAPGVAHLATAVPGATFVPMALEYTHWEEKQPEMLVRFGAALPACALRDLRVSERIARLEAELAGVMDALAADSIAHNEAAFSVLVSGRRGVNPVYDRWRRARAAWRGESFDPGHGVSRR